MLNNIVSKIRKTDREDFVAEIYCPNYVVWLLPSSADAKFTTYISDSSIKKQIKKILIKAVNDMEIKHDSEA